MSRLSDVVEFLANWMGYDLTAKWRRDQLPLARKLRQVFAHHAIGSVLDIGANEGQHAAFLRDFVGFSGRIVSFEPDPDLAGPLAARAAGDPRWTVRQVALGATAGTLPFHRMRGTQFNSLRPPDPAQPAYLREANTVVTTIEVPVQRLDDLASDLPPPDRCFVKIDTQGFDLEVLAGGRAYLSRVPALLTEVSFRRIYAEGPDFRAALDAFAGAGFAVADFFVISHDNDFRATEFDCLMVRADK